MCARGVVGQRATALRTLPLFCRRDCCKNHLRLSCSLSSSSTSMGLLLLPAWSPASSAGNPSILSAVLGLPLRCPDHKTRAWAARKGTGESVTQVDTWFCTLVRHMASSPQQTNRQQMGGIFPYPHAVAAAAADHFRCSLQVCYSNFWGARMVEKWTPP